MMPRVFLGNARAFRRVVSGVITNMLLSLEECLLGAVCCLGHVLWVCEYVA